MSDCEPSSSTVYSDRYRKVLLEVSSGDFFVKIKIRFFSCEIDFFVETHFASCV